MTLTVILRILESNDFKKSNKKSEHLNSREQRLRLSIDTASLIHHYEVYNKKDNVRQVHSLYNDGTLFIYNIKTGLIITVILLKRNELAKYLSFTGENFNDYPVAHKCAKLHEQMTKNETEINLDNTRERKIKIVESYKEMKK